jgi:hypothetical protein
VVRPPPPAPAEPLPKEGGTSAFRFVYWDSKHERYKALVTVEKRKRDLGAFEDEEAAALAVDNVLHKWGGPHARVNFPKGAPERVVQALEAHEARAQAMQASLARGGSQFLGEEAGSGSDQNLCRVQRLPIGVTRCRGGGNADCRACADGRRVVEQGHGIVAGDALGERPADGPRVLRRRGGRGAGVRQGGAGAPRRELLPELFPRRPHPRRGARRPG